jgi:hypothetical protein
VLRGESLVASWEPLLNIGNRGQSGGFPGFDQLSAPAEGVPIDSTDVGSDTRSLSLR